LWRELRKEFLFAVQHEEMKVAGFSFIKNAVKYQYPIVEALQSILPICDEVIVAVGNSEDNTRELVGAIDPVKIKIVDSVWDENLKKDGKVLAAETDKAFAAISNDADWCVYIQGDEVLHEKYHDEVYLAMQRWKDEKAVDGLLFNYLHFYGSYDYTGVSSQWYKKEIRVVRNDRSIYSYRDAQGFRKGDNQKLRVKPLAAYIYHYGWVREPNTMQAKINNVGRYWKGDEYSEQMEKTYSGAFDYANIDALEKFTGTHPKPMQHYVDEMNWKFEFDPAYNRLKTKEKFKNLVEKVTGARPFDYKNYKIV
jgi:hypothetical protein